MRPRPAPSAVRMPISRARDRRARDQQVGDVDARDEQHARDGAEQHDERRAHARHQHVVKRHQRRALAGRFVRVRVLVAGRNGIDFRERLRARHAGAQTSDHHQIVQVVPQLDR